ncbi:NAD(P)-dependent dehydrogenase (short-subunit alcohol dehydrogenase family) [Saccharothrix carnea]|uniref:NAD(P)-dependent dehydrogenase (Short-subunit alcohol dehydrogenase family) n=1 Tax=Saccharothrix carnea TaxID=1280637 RepID=A0A2P8IBG2_SACCR|nr:SDR family NAD(P)-dependent oxidoreductase [Saccharothrix carnea]PSL55809.1 NAD(P)-dependent dehydrogenase (short-subunit alcohol dehydrogenase family) [Saccharothrix carnea]
MKTIVVTGGTSGIGLALARTCLDRGDEVVVVGPDPVKGERYLDAARRAGAADRAHFLQADLSLVAENRRVVKEITARFPVVHALVLCARYFRSRRVVTAEGFEHNFALYYLSRYLLGHGLADRLDQAEHPVVVNLAGPGVGTPDIRWDDLELAHGYDGWSAMFQGGRLNDLLGVSFAGHGYRARYVLLFPGGTRTGFAGDFDPASAAQADRMKRAGQPVELTIPRIVGLIDSPPREPLSAFVEDTRIGLAHPSFDQAAAARLEGITRDLLGDEPRVR